jgi:crotonobetainyl-CoA:carnitine CoA-transferase CaiB-like acyl-CoA transferase
MQVVDLSSGRAGAYCAKLLADGGADVVKVEDAGGDPLRRVVECGAPLAAGDDGALFRFLCASSESVVGDVGFARELVARADVVVWSAGSTVANDPACAPRVLHAAHPDLVVVALSAFGLDSPWADRPTNDFTRQALCGGHVQRGTPTRPPLMCGGMPGEWAAGTYGAIGALAAWRRVVDGGGGELVDVAALDALMYSQPLYPVTWFQVAGEPFRPLRSSQLPSVHPTADGWVSLQTTTGQQWLDFCVMVGRDDWLADEAMARGTYRTLHRDEIEPVIDAWTSARTTDAVVELATALRIPVAEVGNGANLPHFDHLVDGGWFATNAHGCTQPAVPYRLGGDASPRPFGVAPPLGRDTERQRARVASTVASTAAPPSTTPSPDATLPLAGVRVLDLTAFWAGPLIGHACAILGAEVIHVESTKQPDGIRCNTTRPMSEPQWWEWCPMFQGSNTNKLDLALELDTERGRALFLDLVAASDVVIENFSPRVLEQLGLDQDVLLARNPRVVVLRAPGYGIEGEWRERLAYAPTIEAQAGIAWTTGFPDRGPEPPSGIADAMGGAHATFALLLALEHRRRTGRGMFLECPMVGASLNVAAQQIVEFAAYGVLLERLGNRSATGVAQGVFRTADVDADGTQDRWVAVSVEDDAQRHALAAVLGVAVDDDQFEDRIAGWCAARATDDIVATVSGVGVPCEPVVRAHEHDRLPPVVARSLFERVDHPVTGTADYIGAPFRFTRGPRHHHRARSPLLGEHNRDVLTRVLSLSNADVDQLEADGVIGDVVVGGVLH